MFCGLWCCVASPAFRPDIVCVGPSVIDRQLQQLRLLASYLNSLPATNISDALKDGGTSDISAKAAR